MESKYPWFRFYGQDWLTDIKITSLKIEDRLCYITLLCLASSSSERGVIYGCDEESIIRLTHLHDNAYDDDNEVSRARGCLNRFVAKKMITNDNETIVIIAFQKRQETALTGYERVKRFREKNKQLKAQTSEMITNDNDRVEESREEKNKECVILKNKKGEDLTSMKASDYSPDGWSPLDRKKMLRSLARSLGEKKTNEWSDLLFGSAWDFKKGFAHFQGYEYPDNILLDEVSKTLAKWYEMGETRDTIRDMMTAFFKGKKAGAVTITPNSVFSSHTYNSWKQNKL